MSFSGCSTVIKSANDIANIAIVDEQITSGQVMQTIKYANLSTTELMIVDHANNKYIYFADKWKRSITTLDSSTPLFAEFIGEYEELIKQYRAVESIIAKNWNVYPTRYQVILLDYQLRAKKVNNVADKLITANEMREAMETGIMLAKVVAGIIK
jgi:hypothetical protein